MPMTRETKVGLVVASSFICLVGVVVASKMRHGDLNASQTATPAEKVAGDNPFADASKPPDKPGTVPAKFSVSTPVGDVKAEVPLPGVDSVPPPPSMQLPGVKVNGEDIKLPGLPTAEDVQKKTDELQKKTVDALNAAVKGTNDTIKSGTDAVNNQLAALAQPAPPPPAVPEAPLPGKDIPPPLPAPTGAGAPLPPPLPGQDKMSNITKPSEVAPPATPPFANIPKPEPSKVPPPPGAETPPPPAPFASAPKPADAPPPPASPFGDTKKPTDAAPPPPPLAVPGTTAADNKPPVPAPSPFGGPPAAKPADPAPAPNSPFAGNKTPPPLGATPPPLGASAGGSNLPQVKSFSIESYTLKPEDNSFAALSQRLYNTDKYGPALLQFNREWPNPNKGVLQDPPVLQPGQKIYIPPSDQLEARYASLVQRGNAPLGASPFGGSPPPPASFGPAPGTSFQPPAGNNPLGSAPPPPLGARATPTFTPASTSNGFAPSVPLGQASTPAVQTTNVPALNVRTPAGGTADATRRYRVRDQGQHIIEIARQTLGDGSRWSEIYRLNPSIQPQFPIPGGTEIQLPATAVVP